jgi:hypothetical protein
MGMEVGRNNKTEQVSFNSGMMNLKKQKQKQNKNEAVWSSDSMEAEGTYFTYTL